MKIRHLLVALLAMVSFGAVACGGSEPVADEQPIETPIEEAVEEEAPAETAPADDAGDEDAPEAAEAE